MRHPIASTTIDHRDAMNELGYCVLRPRDVDDAWRLRGPFATRLDARTDQREGPADRGALGLLVMVDPAELSATGRVRVLKRLQAFLAFEAHTHDGSPGVHAIPGPVSPLAWCVCRDETYEEWAMVGPYATKAEAEAEQRRLDDGYPADRGEIAMVIEADSGALMPAQREAIWLMVRDALDGEAAA